jgi:type I restriction enzyme R subunit
MKGAVGIVTNSLDKFQSTQDIPTFYFLNDDAKTYGLLVDYWGVSQNLASALSAFQTEDVAHCMQKLTDELPRLESRHQAVMNFFNGKKRDDSVRADFDPAFKRFAASLDMVLPDPSGLNYMDDLR